MSSEEIEEYQELLKQLEPTSEEENDVPSEGTSQLVQYFWCDKSYALVLVFFTALMYFEIYFLHRYVFCCSRDVKMYFVYYHTIMGCIHIFLYDTIGFVLFMYGN